MKVPSNTFVTPYLDEVIKSEVDHRNSTKTSNSSVRNLAEFCLRADFRHLKLAAILRAEFFSADCRRKHSAANPAIYGGYIYICVAERFWDLDITEDRRRQVARFSHDVAQPNTRQYRIVLSHYEQLCSRKKQGAGESAYRHSRWWTSCDGQSGHICRLPSACLARRACRFVPASGYS